MEIGTLVVENATGREAKVLEYNPTHMPQYLVEFTDDKEKAFIADFEIHPKSIISSLLRIEIRGKDPRLVVSDPFKPSVWYYIQDDGIEALDKFIQHYKRSTK